MTEKPKLYLCTCLRKTYDLKDGCHGELKEREAEVENQAHQIRLLEILLTKAIAVGRESVEENRILLAKMRDMNRSEG